MKKIKTLSIIVTLVLMLTFVLFTNLNITTFLGVSLPPSYEMVMPFSISDIQF